MSLGFYPRESGAGGNPSADTKPPDSQIRKPLRSF
jgi:hypothetical protein